MRRSRFFATLIIGIQLVPSIVLAQSSQALKGGPIHAPVTQSSPSPSPSATQSPTSTPASPLRPTPSPSPVQFCDNLSSITGKIGPETDSQFNQLKTNFIAGPAKVKSVMNGVSQSLTTARATADQKRIADFAQLSAKATTPAQKQAIATFEASVTTAITAERAAVDTADATFSQSILADMAARQSALQAAAATYRTAIQSALSAAQTSCSRGISPETVRATLQASLQAARTALQTASNTPSANQPSLSVLEVTRKAAVTQAGATAKMSITQALQTLKTALGISGTQASPSPLASPVD
jgi:hypothetical protein